MLFARAPVFFSSWALELYLVCILSQAVMPQRHATYLIFVVTCPPQVGWPTCPNLSGTFLVSAWIVQCPGNPLISRQTYWIHSKYSVNVLNDLMRRMLYNLYFVHSKPKDLYSLPTVMISAPCTQHLSARWKTSSKPNSPCASHLTSSAPARYLSHRTRVLRWEEDLPLVQNAVVCSGSSRVLSANRRHSQRHEQL